MRIDLRRVESLMAKNFLNGTHVNSLLEHQCRGGMPELVGRNFIDIKACCKYFFLNH